MADPHKALADEATHKLLRLLRHLHCYSHHMQQHGISGRQMAILLHLAEDGPVTVGQMARYLYRSKSTASTTLAALEKAGYVTRARSTQDQRVVAVEITPAGREAIARIPIGGIPLLRQQIKTLPPEELEHTIVAIERLMGLLDLAAD